MSPARKRSRLWLLPSLYLIHTTSAAIDFNGYYPAGSISCLNSAMIASKCDQSSVAVFNPCACSNGGGFVDLTAKCLGQSDRGDLGTVYGNLNQYCSDSNTPLAVSQDKFLSAAGAAATTPTIPTTQATTVRTSAVQTVIQPSAVLSTLTIGSAPPGGSASVTVITLGAASASASTSSSLSTSTSPADAKTSALSTGAIVGISLGVGIPILLTLVGILFTLVWRGQRAKHSYSPPGGSVVDYAEPATAVPTKPRPVSSVTTLSGHGANNATMNTYPTPDYSPPTHLVVYDSPMQNGSDRQRNSGYGAPPPGVVEVHGTPVARPHELPGGYYHY